MQSWLVWFVRVAIGKKYEQFRVRPDISWSFQSHNTAANKVSSPQRHQFTSMYIIHVWTQQSASHKDFCTELHEYYTMTCFEKINNKWIIQNKDFIADPGMSIQNTPDEHLRYRADVQTSSQVCSKVEHELTWTFGIMKKHWWMPFTPCTELWAYTPLRSASALVIMMQRQSKRSSGPVRVNVRPVTQNMSLGCVACHIIEAAPPLRSVPRRVIVGWASGCDGLTLEPEVYRWRRGGYVQNCAGTVPESAFCQASAGIRRRSRWPGQKTPAADRNGSSLYFPPTACWPEQFSVQYSTHHFYRSISA